jgi:hypothetical protein
MVVRRVQRRVTLIESGACSAALLVRRIAAKFDVGAPTGLAPR